MTEAIANSPLALLLVGFILTNLILPFIKRGKKDQKDTPAVTVGEPVSASAGWETSRDLYERLLADERADHDHCDALLTQHGIELPHSPRTD
ncbi:hypothetical protein [Janibacter melonis]|uniref:hypothetical protein n=1 Tax=Janibacter melonis TaxID=262209 RepID=UPI00174BBAE9|nr:hypothetical protein [Janibacter melonis]